MADDVVLMIATYKRILETFKMESSKHLLWEALKMLFEGQDVFLIQSTRSRKFESEHEITNKVKKERDKPKHGAQERK